MAIGREPRRQGGAEHRRRARPAAQAGGRRHLRHRQREHVRRAAPGLGRAGLRSAQLRAGRLRRRRPAARQRARQADGLLAGDRAAGPGRAVRLWRRHDAAARRGVAHAGRALRRRPATARSRRPCRISPRRPAETSSARASTAPSSRSSTSSTCAMHGQGTALGVTASPEEFRRDGLKGIARRFDDMHEQLFTFSARAPHELRQPARRRAGHSRRSSRRGSSSRATAIPRRAVTADTTVFVDGARPAGQDLRPRRSCAPATGSPGPAIVTEMDSTTLILPDHYAEVDRIGSILIRPVN